MTEIFRRQIEHPSAWTSAALGGLDGITVTLGAAQLAAVDRLLERNRGKVPKDLGLEDFRHPDLDPFLAGIRREVMAGRGAVLIRGLSAARHGADGLEAIYAGFANHWGRPAVQSRNGEKVAHVRREKENPTQRGHKSNQELSPHCDAYEVVGLLCVEQAAEGGQSQLVSSLAIHNEILRTRPDLLPALYEGYHHMIFEALVTDDPVTPYKIPIYCAVDGLVSCMYSRANIDVGYQRKGIPLSGQAVAAMDYLEAIAADDRFRLAFTLEPGEIALWHNFTVLHSRSAFTDDETRSRHLLRLWLSEPDGRPVVPEFHRRGEMIEKIAEAWQANRAVAG